MAEKYSSEFDRLLTKSVPHIVEKIFFSLDYASFKKCHKVSKAWREMLSSELFLKKANHVYSIEILQENINNDIKLVTSSNNGDVEEVKHLLTRGVNPNCKYCVMGDRKGHLLL